MLSTWVSLMTVLCFCQTAEDGHTTGYLTSGKKGAEIARPYIPKEGDLIFYDDHNPIWTALFVWVGSGPPLHVGVIVKKTDGALAILEAGPNDSIRVYLLDPAPHLTEFYEKYRGTVTIRRCKKDLSAEQSEALAKFAMAQEGKRYAVLRLLLQGTAFTMRGPIRELFLAQTDLDRSSWMCGELTVAAGTVAGLFPRSVKSNVTYPLDIVNNQRHRLGKIWDDAQTWTPHRQAR